MTEFIFLSGLSFKRFFVYLLLYYFAATACLAKALLGMHFNNQIK